MANVKISELSPLITVQDADVLPIVDNAVTKKVTAAILRSYTQGNSVLLTGAQTVAGIKTFTSQLASSVATGTAPFSVASTTKVTNLNADLLDGLSSADFQATLGGTGIVKSTAGTISYLTDNTANWDAAYNDKINSATVTGIGTNTLTLTQQDAGTITATWVNGTLIREIRNTTGATLTKGTIVYISGATGNKPTVTKAIATGDETSAQTFGFVQENILDNANGNVVVIGDLVGIDTSAYAEGAQLYLSSTTAGAFTDVKQYAPNHLVYVGIVTRSHPTLGQIEVNIQNGFEMDELHNVAAQNPSNGDILQYVTSTGLWTKIGGTTSAISEGSNLYFTNARSRSAISLTTSGTSGAATYNSTTGVLNVPNYADTDTGITSLNGLTALTQTFAVGTSGTDFGISSATSTHTFNLPTASAANRGALSSADWTTFNNKQTAGNYITALTGEASASGPGSSSITLTNSAVIGKILTGLNVTGGSVSATDSIVDAFGKVQNQINSLIGGTIYKGTWNASTNTPTLTSSVGTQGYYYIVSVAGSTNLDGITSWNVGDWAIFDGTAWQKVDNTDSVVSVNGLTGAVSLTTSNITEGTNLYYTEARVDANSNVAANTAARHNAVTLGTANGLSLSTQALSLGLASGSTNGALSSTDWTTFNNKQNALTNPITGTGTTNYLPKFTGASALGDSQIFDNGTNVGIGTSSPALPLHLYNSAAALAYFESTNANGAYVIWRNSGTSIGDVGSALGISGSNSASDFMVASRSGNMILGTSSAERMRITSAGSVGIGTTSPNHLLTLNQTASGGTYFGLYQSYVDGNDWRNWAIGTNDQAFGDFVIKQSNATGGNPNSAGTNRFYISKAGNVGIGTSSPQNKLVISNGGAQGLEIGADATYNVSVAAYNRASPGYIPFLLDASKIMFGQGNVLINTTTDGPYKLDVNGTARLSGELLISTPDDSGMRIKAGATRLSYIDFADANTGTPSGSIAYNHTSDALIFNTGGSNTERMRITSAGNVQLQQGLSLSGATAQSSGIEFPSTQVASASANNLDDYEEGTFTATLTFGGASVGQTYTANTGSYVKIGRQVTVCLYIEFSNKGTSSGGAVLTGLPFTVASGNSFYSAPAIGDVRNINFINILSPFLVIGTSTINLGQTTNLGAFSVLNETNFANNSEFILTATYFV